MEKTFEELIAENFRNDSLLTQMKVDKLLKQVREATIAECKDKIWNEYGIYRKAHEIEAEFESIPTDRIKTEK